MKVKVLSLLVTRDAMTKIPVDVPAHELEVMQTVFGEDNVQELEQDEEKHVELDPAGEGERLAGKYGEDAVIKTFGENFKGRVGKAMTEFEVKAVKKTAEKA